MCGTAPADRPVVSDEGIEAMRITANVTSGDGQHRARVATDGREHELSIAARPGGAGSATNGGELLFLALATCYCNDLYREAARRDIAISGVTVTVEGTFGGPGESATGVTYHARVDADAPEDEIAALMRHTDTVAEIQNTLRAGVDVTLGSIETVSAARSTDR